MRKIFRSAILPTLGALALAIAAMSSSPRPAHASRYAVAWTGLQSSCTTTPGNQCG